MTTARIQIDEGSTTNLATNTFSEDAVTKHVSRSVLNKSDGTEIGTSSNPLQVTLANTGANGTAVKVDGSASTQPISGTVTATIAAGATTVAKAEDVASAEADVGVPAMAVRKATPANTSGTDGDYEMLQMSAGRLWVDASGKTLTTDSSGVTQPVSGTFWQATQPVSLAAGAAAIAKAEDAASADADVGVPAMAIQKGTPADTAGTDGDYAMLQMSAGRLWVDASGKTLTVASHAVTVASGGVASGAIASGAVASGAIASGAVASGAIASGAFASGSIVAGAVAAGASSFVKLEDAASADADAGVPAMAIQKATPADTAGTDGDYAMLQMSAGRLWTSVSVPSGGIASGAVASGAIASGAVASGAFASGSIAAGAVAAGATSFVKLEDVASADADAGVPAMMIQKATPADTGGTDGDYVMLQGSAGRLWTSANIDKLAGNTISSGVGASGTGTLRTVIANDAGRTIASKAGSVASSGNNTLVSAGTNRLKVFAFSLSTTSTTAVTCIFQDGASGTAIWEVILQAPTSTSTGANLCVTPPAWLFATTAATLLNLNLSGAITVYYSVSYFDEA